MALFVLPSITSIALLIIYISAFVLVYLIVNNYRQKHLQKKSRIRQKYYFSMKEILPNFTEKDHEKMEELIRNTYKNSLKCSSVWLEKKKKKSEKKVVFIQDALEKC